jgi:hypothetical protein
MGHLSGLSSQPVRLGAPSDDSRRPSRSGQPAWRARTESHPSSGPHVSQLWVLRASAFGRRREHHSGGPRPGLPTPARTPHLSEAGAAMDVLVDDPRSVRPALWRWLEQSSGSLVLRRPASIGTGPACAKSIDRIVRTGAPRRPALCGYGSFRSRAASRPASSLRRVSKRRGNCQIADARRPDDSGHTRCATGLVRDTRWRSTHARRCDSRSVVACGSDARARLGAKPLLISRGSGTPRPVAAHLSA